MINKREFLFLISFILVLFFSFSCTGEKAIQNIYQSKGYENQMVKRLKPVIIKTNFQILDVESIGIPGCLATTSKKSEFALLHIDEAGTITVDPVVPGFPGKLGQNLITDGVHNAIWMTRGRGFYVLDMETKKTGHIIVSNNGNDSISTTYLFDPEKKHFFIKVMPPYPVQFYYILYDLFENKEVINSKQYNGRLYPYTKGNFLFCEFTGDNNEIVSWKIVDKEFNVIETNNLTDKLTEFQIDVYPRTKAFHMQKRIMFGTSRPMEKLTFYTVVWDEDLEDVKIEPIILQIPKKTKLQELVEFSPDGAWMKSVARSVGGQFLNPPELVIYHVGDMYPQHLSMPIMCGYTKKGNDGAFMNHPEWGPCYVELDYEFRNKLFVYKLDDGLKLLAEQAIEIGGK